MGDLAGNYPGLLTNGTGAELIGRIQIGESSAGSKGLNDIADTFIGGARKELQASSGKRLTERV